ncbi:MAG: hypothetical protein IJ193_07105 [Bacilli bacterium]|nr:hypothetical protein [Bacilli bacterium]
MFPKAEELKKLIDDEIEDLRVDLNQFSREYQKTIDFYHSLVDDPSKIVYSKNGDLKEYINHFDVEDKDAFFKDILSIKKIYTLNKDYESTLRLSRKEKKLFREFLDQLYAFSKTLTHNNDEKNKILEKIEKYNGLLGRVDGKPYIISSEDRKLFDSLFRHHNNEKGKVLLIELMNYEQKQFRYKKRHSKLRKIFNIDEEDLIQIFKKYDYRFKDLDDYYQFLLKKNGNLNTIDEVFSGLKDNLYPKVENPYVLTSLLLGSNRLTIDNVTSFSLENKLIPKSLLDISGALLIQTDFVDDGDEYSYMIQGSSLDFMNNIVTLKNAGLSINYIYQECKSILTMPNALLKKNLDLFYKYGFSFDYKRKGVVDPSPASLLSPNFAEICDAFIEVHPLGLKYITDNLSNLRTVSNPDGLLFYNIYMSGLNYDEKLKDDPNNGPFRKVVEDGSDNYQLKAMITRNMPGFKNQPYYGITEDNKKEITGTIEVPIPEKKKFDHIIEQNLDFMIYESIFNNPYIEAIDKYLDVNNALIYNFKGIIISRLKVLRIYSILLKKGIEDNLDAFLYAITYHSILREEDYICIVDLVKKEIEVG